jgi:hypothetical protein
MSQALLDRVVECQSGLIAALDARDSDAINAAVSELHAALDALKQEGAFRSCSRETLDHAIKQAHAARIRTNILADWTRQRIDRLAQIRGHAPARTTASYANSGI